MTEPSCHMEQRTSAMIYYEHWMSHILGEKSTLKNIHPQYVDLH